MLISYACTVNYVVVTILGLIFGSFVNALVWRLHESERKKSDAPSIWHGRSICTHCKHQLGVWDLIPVLSWLFLGGKCRYCKKPISSQYPLVELLVMALFLVSYVFWPFQLTSLANYFLLFTFYFLLTLGVALTVYDLKWMILPTRLVYVFNGLSGLFLVILSLLSLRSQETFISGIIGAAIFSGFFYLLYHISNGTWIGGGDVRLAVGLGLILGWQKSILSLTVAAYLGTAVILILLVVGKYHKKMKLPFGPFLLTATYLTILWGQSVIDWYLRLGGL